MKMLIAIDGAGDVGETEAAYTVRYNESSTRALYLRATERNHYIQAERVLTGNVYSQALDVANWISENTSEGDEIAFVGYSRGGAACLIAASLISGNVLFSDEIGRRDEVRNVIALGLFDPVANQTVADYYCSHESLLHTHVYLARRSDLGVIGRFTFPPIEVSIENIPLLQERTFDGGHGELGSTSWDAYLWIGNHLASHGFIHFDTP
jgi:hypothetical protein